VDGDRVSTTARSAALPLRPATAYMHDRGPYACIRKPPRFWLHAKPERLDPPICRPKAESRPNFAPKDPSTTPTTPTIIAFSACHRPGPCVFSVFPLSFLDDPIDHGTVDARQPLSLTPRYPTCHPSKDQLPRDKRQPVSKMATPEARATDLKNQGNKAFAAHDWPTAIDFYSQAIKLNDKEPAFWSNRAQVRARRPRQPRLAPPFCWSRD